MAEAMREIGLWNERARGEIKKSTFDAGPPVRMGVSRKDPQVER